MKCWIFTHIDNPRVNWLDGFEERFDAWEAGGVCGLVVGYMRLVQEDGTSVQAYVPDPKVYAAHDAKPPAEMPRNPELEKKLQAMLDDAASRGWPILLFGGIGSTAQAQDLMNAFPQASGFVIDGPGENHYELAFHHHAELLEIRPGEETRFTRIGADLDRLQRGIDRMRQRLHELTPEKVRYHASGGLFGSLLLCDLDEDVLYWLRMRQEASRSDWQQARICVDGVDRKVKLGGIPRTAAFSSLTGQNYQQMPQYFDYIFPKHYFWHRGFDGLYGTVARWVHRLKKWNPSLQEADCFAVVRALFGIDLPEVNSLLDMELGFPEEFFSRIVHGETRRALDAVGDADRVIAWVSTGRSPHAGDSMSARDLNAILTTSREAGLKHFLFHPDPDLGAAEWRIISNLCGELWDDTADGYWPGGTPRLDSFSGNRQPPNPD